MNVSGRSGGSTFSSGRGVALTKYVCTSTSGGSIALTSLPYPSRQKACVYHSFRSFLTNQTNRYLNARNNALEQTPFWRSGHAPEAINPHIYMLKGQALLE